MKTIKKEKWETIWKSASPVTPERKTQLLQNIKNTNQPKCKDCGVDLDTIEVKNKRCSKCQKTLNNSMTNVMQDTDI